MRTLVDQRLRRRLLILASMALGAVGAGPSRASAQTGTIVGRVTDSRSGQGVQNVAIQIEGTRFTTGTNVDGRYRLDERARWVAHVDGATHRLLGRAKAGRRRGGSRSDAGHHDAAGRRRARSGRRHRHGRRAGASLSRQRRVHRQRDRSHGASAAARHHELSRAASRVFRFSTAVDDSAPVRRFRFAVEAAWVSKTVRSSTSTAIRVNNATGTGPSAPAGRLGGQSSAVAGRLNDISPDDIESIQIIKGPAAATIYGTEAANGVMQIITKKGASSGRSEFSAQIAVWNAVVPRRRKPNADQLLQGQNWARSYLEWCAVGERTVARRCSRTGSRDCTTASSPVRATKCATISPPAMRTTTASSRTTRSGRRRCTRTSTSRSIRRPISQGASTSSISREHLGADHWPLGDVRHGVWTSAAVDGAGGSWILLELPARSSATII